MKKPDHNIKRVGIIGNSGKISRADEIDKAARCIRAAGRQLYLDAATAALTGTSAEVLPDALALSKKVDLILVLGGDGTFLRVAREIAGSRTPMLGINIGALGFLTAVPSGELAAALKHVWKGEFEFESRSLIHATGHANGRPVDQAALNDIVVSRGIASRLIELDVKVNGDSLSRYRCDGLILSSPTGSTAYSLAAGGAVVFPTAEVMCLTPICPHTLSNRSLILPLSATVEITIISPKPATILSTDGQMVSELAPDDVITVRRSHRSVRLMHLAGTSFCETLRKKLHWRGGSV
ncbi:MAG TPA: NAD(+)/NADH kinase [Verrucomicrobiae bacterium]|nr:NAD(+)/NADH kinase [Verrucomicrobiae bacterium]